MRVRIHRGAHEIGGSCVEVESGGARLVLDLGRPLSADRKDEVALPAVTGLEDGDPGLQGVVITHAHQDHWGLAGQVAPGVPIFMGAATARILAEAAFWTTGLTIPPAGLLVHRKAFDLGPFRITPYLNDHSAFDAYSLLVQADGRSLFYTGDIRGHGRKAAIFEELLRKPPTDVDVLLMEGTNIRPEGADSEAHLPEDALERRCAEAFQATTGMVLIMFSAQNIDRLVTLYRASRRSGREFVMDLYTASVAAATENPNIPRPGSDWPHVRVFIPHWQRVKVKESGEFDRVTAVKPYRVFQEELATQPARFVTKFDASMAAPLSEHGGLAGARVFWSMWAGYLEEPSGQRLRRTLQNLDIPMEIEHSSGHASIADLQRLAGALHARRVVPIHSFAGHRFGEFFEGVTIHADGEWWEV